MALRTLEPGLRIGKYEIVAHIASGGMGAVYKATDRELRRTVALKVLPSHRAQNGNDLVRFQREARHAARLCHPNIVTLYDYGYDEAQDVNYLAMEFIDGYDLAHLISRKGRLEPRDARRILKQAAEALDHAYSQGVIHRDIKPSNFLLARIGGKTVVKLTDMGLAIVDDDEEFRVTREGRTVGTIDYMAPEQARDSRAADIRSDIYSLGCTAYHMLAGKAPFAEGGLGERVYKHQNVPPADVREVNPGVSAAFWGILQKMLAKQPDDRYATPGELVAELKRTQAEVNEEDPELAPLPPPVVEAPRPPETLREPSTPPEPTTVAVAKSIEEPRPRKKKPRAQSKKAGIDPWRFVGPGIGLGVVLIGGLIGWEAWKTYAQRKADPDSPQVKGPEIQPGGQEAVLPKRTVEDPVKSPRPRPDDIVEPVTILEPFKGREWPGRQFVPFSAVAPRAKLDEIKAVQIKGQIIVMAGSPAPINMTLAWESQKRVKYQEIGINNLSVLLVGDQGWLTTGKLGSPAKGDLLNFLQCFNYATMLSNLIQLTDREFTIDQGESSIIRGRECFSIRVSRPNRPTVTMFFDKASSLLFKAEYQARLIDPNTAVVQANATRVELYFPEYRLVDGIKHWRKMEQWRDGKRFSELTLTEVRFFAKADDALFLSDGLDDAAQRAMIDYCEGQVKRGLAQTGASAGSDFTRLVHGLSLKEPTQRWTVRDGVLAYAELLRRNQAAALQATDLPALNTLLLCKDDELPGIAIEAITRMGPQAAKAAPHLVTLAQTSGNPKIVAGALGALKSTAVRTEPVLDLLVKLLDHADAAVKNPAALALFELGPERLTVDRVSALMAWPGTEVRAEAGKLLRQRLAAVTPKEMPMLREGLKNPVREVRLAFIDAVASLRHEGQPATPDLLPLLIASDKEIAGQTVRALDMLGKLTDLARDNGDPAVMAAAIAALRGKALKTPESLAIYEMHLDHGSDAVKNAAALALIELGPERLSKERLIEFMSRPKPVDLAATFALHKADPANASLKTKGTDILVRELAPDVSDLKGFLGQPVQGKPAAVLLDIASPKAIVPVVKQLLSDNNPKTLSQNQKMEPTAARLLGYELLREFAKRAKTKQDRELIAALKKQDSGLKIYWWPEEDTLAKRMKTLKGITPEVRQLHVATAEAAWQAHLAIDALRLP